VPVITLSRQFGAGGAAVGRLVARRFEAEYLDREVVFEAARRTGIPEAVADELDERAPGWVTRLGMALAAAYPEVIVPDVTPVPPVPGYEDRLAEVAREVIEEAADRGNAVIVGRGGAFILAGRPGVLHVQLEASLEARVRFSRLLVEEPGGRDVPDDAAFERLCAEVDQARGAFIRRHFAVDWRDPSHYHLVLDTGRLGLETTAELIELAARRLSERS
jgi:cytidylate kinase